METKKSRERIYLFDNLKFFLIITVVIGHCDPLLVGDNSLFRSITVFVYTFHMPLFIFCSGLFHSNKDVLIKALRYISVGFATKILFSLTGLGFYGNIKFNLLQDGGAPWFMFVLAIYTVITYLLRDIDKRYLLVFSVLLAMFTGYDSSIGDYLYISRAIVFYPFYLAGQMITKENLISLSKNKALKIISVLIISAWLVLCFIKTDTVSGLMPLFSGRNSFEAGEILKKWGFIFRGICYVITMVISACLVCLTPDKKMPVITKFGSRTLQVYFWHWTFICLLDTIGIQSLLKHPTVGQTAWVFIGIILTFILSTKPFAFPTKQIFTYCRYLPKTDAAENKQS